jgi:hypothetical protein
MEIVRPKEGPKFDKNKKTSVPDLTRTGAKNAKARRERFTLPCPGLGVLGALAVEILV